MADFFNSKKFIIILVVLLICIGLFGCGQKQLNLQEPEPEQKVTTIDTIGRMDGIIGVLGCMFGGVCK